MISESDACKIICAARDVCKVAFSFDDGESEVVVSLSSLALILRDMCDVTASSAVDALARWGNVNPSPVDEIVAALKKYDSERSGLT